MTPEEDTENMRSLWGQVRAAEEDQQLVYKAASEALQRAAAARDAALETALPIGYTREVLDNWSINARRAHQDVKEAQAGADISRKASRERTKMAQMLFAHAMDTPDRQTEMEFVTEIGVANAETGH